MLNPLIVIVMKMMSDTSFHPNLYTSLIIEFFGFLALTGIVTAIFIVLVEYPLMRVTDKITKSALLHPKTE